MTAFSFPVRLGNESLTESSAKVQINFKEIKGYLKVLSQGVKNEKSSTGEGLNFQRAASINLNSKHYFVILTMSRLYHLSSLSFTQSSP